MGLSDTSSLSGVTTGGAYNPKSANQSTGTQSNIRREIRRSEPVRKSAYSRKNSGFNDLSHGEHLSNRSAVDAMQEAMGEFNRSSGTIFGLYVVEGMIEGERFSRDAELG